MNTLEMDRVQVFLPSTAQVCLAEWLTTESNVEGDYLLFGKNENIKNCILQELEDFRIEFASKEDIDLLIDGMKKNIELSF